MFKELQFEIRGIAPLLMHNGRLANPLNPIAKAMKVITAKRKKTDADYEALARLEWEGGLYHDDEGRPIIPGENIEGAFIDGGRKQRMGDAFKAGLFSDGNWDLVYDGPKTKEKLIEDARFRDTRRAPIGGASVMRTRPIFRNWSVKFTVAYLPDLLNPDAIRETLSLVGRTVGICDYTPKFGRFEVL